MLLRMFNTFFGWNGFRVARFTDKVCVTVFVVVGFYLLPVVAICSPVRHDISIDSGRSLQPVYKEDLLRLLNTSKSSLSKIQIQRFVSLLRRYGWPTVLTVGKQGVDAAAEIAVRASSDYKLQDDLENLVLRRVGIDINVNAFAHWVDRIEFCHNKEQQFGTLVKYVKGSGVVVSPVVDVESANIVRDELGMPLLKEYLSRVRAFYRKTGSVDLPFPEFAKVYTPYTKPGLRKKLALMAQADQNARFKALRVGGLHNKKLNSEIKDVDAKNLRTIKSIFHHLGIPSQKMVGRDGVSTYFLLVQHADADPKFQRRVLKLAAAEMKVNSLSVPRRMYALLTDRVAVASGKKQTYGTQVRIVKGGLEPFPVKDPGELDARRRLMALGSERTYLSRMKGTYLKSSAGRAAK